MLRSGHSIESDICDVPNQNMFWEWKQWLLWELMKAIQNCRFSVYCGLWIQQVKCTWQIQNWSGRVWGRNKLILWSRFCHNWLYLLFVSFSLNIAFEYPSLFTQTCLIVRFRCLHHQFLQLLVLHPLYFLRFYHLHQSLVRHLFVLELDLARF